MNRKERIKILEKLAQAAGTTGTTGTTGTGTSGPSNTTTQTSPLTIQRSPAASIIFPSLATGWDASRVPYINQVASMLDISVGSATQNKYNFRILWDSKFPAGPESEYASPTKDLLVLFRQVFKQFLNNGIPFRQPLNAGEVTQRVNAVLQAPEISKLEQVNQSGALGSAGVSLPRLRQALTNMLPANAAPR